MIKWLVGVGNTNTECMKRGFKQRWSTKRKRTHGSHLKSLNTEDYDICIAHVHKKIEKQLLNLVNVPKPV